MKFTVDRPVADQILESILEEPHKWKTVHYGGHAASQKHKSGLEIWAQIKPGDVKIFSPANLKVIKFTEEQQTRIFNAIVQLRLDTKLDEKAVAKEKIIDMLNNKIDRELIAPAIVIFTFTAIVILALLLAA